jgi:hypothetical protein
MRGRVFAARDFVMRSVLLASVSVAGWATREFGAQRALLLCGAIVLGTGLLALVWARRVDAVTPAPEA